MRGRHQNVGRARPMLLIRAILISGRLSAVSGKARACRGECNTHGTRLVALQFRRRRAFASHSAM